MFSSNPQVFFVFNNNLYFFFQVFHAERVEVKNKVYHKKCASCFNCTKPLSSRDLCDGKDSNIYCSSCYSRKYGAPGYRGKHKMYFLVKIVLLFFGDRYAISWIFYWIRYGSTYIYRVKLLHAFILNFSFAFDIIRCVEEWNFNSYLFKSICMSTKLPGL